MRVPNKFKFNDIKVGMCDIEKIKGRYRITYTVYDDMLHFDNKVKTKTISDKEAKRIYNAKLNGGFKNESIVY